MLPAFQILLSAQTQTGFWIQCDDFGMNAFVWPDYKHVPVI